MNLKNLFNRLVLLISSPAKAWEEIVVEEDKRKVLGGFVYPLIGFCGLAVFLGGIGFSFDYLSLQTTIKKTSLCMIILFCGYFLASYLVNFIGMKYLKRVSELPLCQQFVGYSMSVLFALDILFGLFPSFFIIRLIMQFYMVWIVWEGAQKLMNVEERKLLSYTILVSIVILFSPILVSLFFNHLSILLG